jgi:hypothetical protein
MTVAPGAVAPLLPAQRFKWDAYQRDPAAPNLVISLRLRIKGRLDSAALAASLRALQDAQPALRATFRPGPDGEPVQQVHPAVPVEFDTADVAAEPDPEPAAAGLAAAAAARPFRLDRPGALRALLIRLAELDHLLVLCLPGIVVDGWSAGIILSSLETGYRSLAAGRPLAAADHTEDYLECCHATGPTANPDGSRATDYAHWLAGTPRLVLPTDSPYPTRRSTGGAEIRARLTAAEVEKTAATARLLRTSPSVVLFTAFTVLLARWSGQRRFAVGAFVSGRTRPRSAALVGRFAHVAALPVDLTGCDTSAEAVHRLSLVWWRGHDFHDVPLASIAAKTSPTPPGRLPVCDVAFVHQFAEPSVSVGDHLSIHREREPTAVSPQDLSLFVEPEGADGLCVRLEYRTDLFREPTARAALARFRTVLAELTEKTPDPKGTEDD